MEFVKAHGTGNDFVVLPDWDDQVEVREDLVRALCDRDRGLGADGVIRVVRADGGADAVMDYRNADGSVAEMCGNGVRVTAKFVADRGLVPGGEIVRVRTLAGVVPVHVERDDAGIVRRASVSLGRPIREAERIPFDAEDGETVDVRLEAAGRTVEIAAISMGNPHAVLMVDDVDHAPVREVGSAIENHPRFPAGANVEFVEFDGGAHARVRVWERGVGETAACGTGACAVLAALRSRDVVDEGMSLAFPGGTVEVRADEDGSIILTGGAVEVAHGRLDDDWLAHVRGDGIAR
jgi:diaminopimelate epimerase